MFIVSACLLGINCRYDGKNRKNHEIVKFLKGKEFIMVCPEELGGLSTPRIPCEIVNNTINENVKVINKNGEDLTENFLKGANKVLDIAKSKGIKKAILKAKSPYCGKGLIYDGSFTAKLVKGDGITAKLLKENKIEIFTENEINKIL